MKKTLAAATVAAVAGLAGAANAADLYKGGSLKDAPVFVPPPTWTGFYIGAHVGGAWGEVNNTLNGNWKKRDFGDDDSWHEDSSASGHGSYSESWKPTNDGVFGGGTVGYNWQGAFGNSIVLGFEADFGGIGFSTTNRHVLEHDDYTTKQDASFYADVTGRLGYAFGPALLYAKGGWAYLDSPISFGYNSVAAVKGDSLDGWTVGGGLEYLFTPSWSVKAEYQYFNFGKQSFNYSFSDYNEAETHRWDQSGTLSSELTINTFKVGLNYHFNQVAPVPLK